MFLGRANDNHGILAGLIYYHSVHHDYHELATAADLPAVKWHIRKLRFIEAVKKGRLIQTAMKT